MSLRRHIATAAVLSFVMGCGGDDGGGGGTDAGTALDTGTAADTGAAMDTGVAADTGAETDTGAAADTGAETDAGTATDTGATGDAGTMSGACGDIGKPCAAAAECSPGYECDDFRDMCLPSGRPICGGFAGASCPPDGDTTECRYLISADYGPCLTPDEAICVCRELAHVFACD